jgi:hypothetical protein
VSKKKKVSKKRSLFWFFAKPKRSFACFCTHFAETTMVEVVVGGGVDIAVANNGVLTLGEWLFACVARRSFALSFLRSFVPLFVHLLVRVVAVVGGVDIAVDDNGVPTLGEWLFACVARRSFALSFLRSFVPLFVHSLVCRSFVSLLVCLASLDRSFVRSFACSVVHVGGVDAGVDIAVDDNGVLTLGEWLFACVARSLVRSFARSFDRSFVRSFVWLRSFVRSWWWC